MKIVELHGMVVRIINPGINHCRFIFNDQETGDLLLSVDRTHKLFYEIQNGMILNLKVSLKSLMVRGNYIQNGLSVVAYELQNVKENESLKIEKAGIEDEQFTND